MVRARGSPNTAGAAAEGAAPWPPSQRRSFYAPWIDLDLSAWAETGITQQASGMHTCRDGPRRCRG